MDPETIILSDRERQIPYDITLMWNLNKDTNALIYNQKQNNRCRKLWLPDRKWERDISEVWD